LSSYNTMRMIPQDLRDLLQRAQEFLRSRQSPCYLVGGLLRDQVLQRPIRGWNVDLAVPRQAIPLAQALAQRLSGTFVLLDETNGCARIIVGTDAGRVELDLGDFRGATLDEDLRRRDFTMNAMAIDLAAWLRNPDNPQPLIDPLHGRQALASRTLLACFPGTFEDDPLRILRAFRFVAELSCALDASLPPLMAACAGKLAQVSGERIRDEVFLILETDHASVAWRQLNDLRILDALFPDLIPGRGIDQGPFHHLDVLNHQLETVAQADRILADLAEFSPELRPPLAGYLAVEPVERRSRKALVKLAGLFHDVGKPATRRVKADGDIWFLGHEQFGAELVEPVTQRLRLSNREAQMIRRLVLYHLRPGFLSREPVLTRRAIFRFFRDLEEDGPACLLVWWLDRMATRGSASRLDQIDQQRARLEELLRAYFFKPEEAVRPPKLIDGQALMQALALEPGPLIGKLLRAIEEAQAEGTIHSKDEALALAQQSLRHQTP